MSGGKKVALSGKPSNRAWGLGGVASRGIDGKKIRIGRGGNHTDGFGAMHPRGGSGFGKNLPIEKLKFGTEKDLKAG
ncbi:MAG: hypothetical protein CM15mP130_2970 [Verrucomicrobiota bacterium]|nr:MAG: hypothetical protein CM15mP130_2970 [Verrucomicrobiota bacterium]